VGKGRDRRCPIHGDVLVPRDVLRAAVTFAEVHIQDGDELGELARELLPALRQLLGAPAD
jgi:hypothetical protein